MHAPAALLYAEKSVWQSAAAFILNALLLVETLPH